MGEPNYCETFHGAPANPVQRTAEQWLRLIFEDAPAPVRAGLRMAWRYGLGLRLAAAGTPDHVVGWRLSQSGSDVARITTDSRTLDAALTVTIADTTGERVALTSEVRYRNLLGHLLWLAALPVHRVVAPYLVRRACTRQAAPAS